MDRLLIVGDIFKLPNKGIVLSEIPRKYVNKHFHEEHPGSDVSSFQEVDVGSKIYEAYKKDGTKNKDDKYDKNKIKGNYIVTSIISSFLHPEGTVPDGEDNLEIFNFMAKKIDENIYIGFYQQDNLPEACQAILLPEDVKLV